MNINMTRLTHAALMLAIASTFMVSTAQASSDFPSKTMTILVSYPPGGFNDRVGRMIADDFSERWDIDVIVDNRPGGGTVVGTDYVAKADADGHTLGISPFAFGVNPGLFETLPYDTKEDFRHAIMLGDAFNVLVAYPDFPVDSVDELVEYAKQNPGEINYASAGNGSSNHLSGEMFKALADIDMVHIPYAGSAPARTDLMAGRVDIMFDNYTNVKELVETGSLKALGVTLQQESELMPDVPPVSDTVEGYNVATWWGVYAPAETPDGVIATLNEALNEFLSKQETLDVFATQGITAIGGSPEEAEDYVEAQMETWIPIAEQSDMTAN